MSPTRSPQNEPPDGSEPDAVTRPPEFQEMARPESHNDRQARLEAIRKAIDAGTYDSDELLEKALLKMLRRSDF